MRWQETRQDTEKHSPVCLRDTSANLTDLENVINAQVAKGYRLHTMSTSNGGSKGFGGGDRIQATLVFERLDMR